MDSDPESLSSDSSSTMSSQPRTRSQSTVVPSAVVPPIVEGNQRGATARRRVVRPSITATRGRASGIPRQQIARRGRNRVVATSPAAAYTVSSTTPQTNATTIQDEIPIQVTQQGSAARLSLSTVNHFECIVCLENLDSPATIMPAQNTGEEQSDLLILEVAANQRAPHYSRRGGRGSRQSSRALQPAQVSAIDPREIAATQCGHVYHRYCIEKWFIEQGKKTCPSCRKNLNTKDILKLYPSIGQNNNAYCPSGAFTQTRSDSGPIPSSSGLSTLQESIATGVPQRRQLPPSGCVNPACVDHFMIHETLVQDFTSIRASLESTKDDLNIKTAEMASLQESHDRIAQELTELKATSGVPGRKRGRR